MITFTYTLEGMARNDQTWSVSGEITVDREGEFSRAMLEAQADAFRKLTGGRAVYGRPGETCAGPYRFSRLVIERREA